MIAIDLSGKTALVTGATGQLGRVMARTLAKSGADVILHYFRNQEQALVLQQELEQLGRSAFIIQADIGQIADVIEMRETLSTNFKMPDIVVGNAVSQYEWTSILEQDMQDYVDQFQTTVLQAVHLSKVFVPHMIQQQYGRMIGINTECAMQNEPTQSAYVAGKRGMDGIYRILAKEIGEHQITVNQVAPGWTLSERDLATDPSARQDSAYIQQVPLQRRGTDQEIANVVAFLASDLASYITGAYIPVTGGNVMPAI
ncbi:SDR family NAD(P)-dependent oxidoreductase [Paenibacillus nicotianae]|uniref:SDR family NAD(P)-dependent oxidoreductase n=1 Tax=Paenibacillus nicotianae TaxID=1526551 RepID=A0ABW4UY12_9BACL